MKKKFTDTFRIKLENGIRLVQHHVSGVIRTMGFEVAATVQDAIYTDLLTCLWKTRFDDEVRHVETPGAEWALFKTLMTDEMNTMNQEIQSLMKQNMPDLMKLNRYEMIVVITCDRIVDVLNAEFSLLEKKA